MIKDPMKDIRNNWQIFIFVISICFSTGILYNRISTIGEAIQEQRDDLIATKAKMNQKDQENEHRITILEAKLNP